MKTSEVLRAARALIEEPKHWAKGGWAYDINGSEVTPGDARACSWCSAGAVEHLMPHDSTDDLDGCTQALGVLVGCIPGHASDYDWDSAVDSIATWQDRRGRTHAEVLAAFACAIEKAEQEEQS